MADWAARVWDKPWNGAVFTGGAIWNARVWPQPSDIVAPVVTLVSPAAGAEVAPATPLVVDVTDANPFRRVFVVAKFPLLGIAELVHDGGAGGFEALYAKNSTRVVIAAGFRLSVVRGAGWPFGTQVELKVYAIDIAGNEG